MSAKRFALFILLMLAVASCVPPVGPSLQPTPEIPIEAIAAPNSVLVQYKLGTSKSQRSLAEDVANGKTVHEFALVPGLEKLAVTDVDAALKSLSRLPYVEYAEPDYLLEPNDTIPNDPMFDRLWGMINLRAPAAWDITTGQQGVTVAVIDTGVDYNHPDLASNIWLNNDEIPDNNIDDDGNGYVDDVRGWDFYEFDNDPTPDYWHGTHIAGTTAAVGNNAQGVVGVAWQAKLMPLRFMTASGGFTSDAIRALEYAVANGAQISTHSYSSPVRSSSFNSAVRAAGRLGHLLIAAAGNSSGDNDVTPYYPASYDLDNLISVAAIDQNENLASFSNYGALSVDLGAPGVGIFSTTPGGLYQSANGTSMAVPHVAGVAALIASIHPDWGPSEIRNHILATTHSLPSLAGRVATGGTLDAAAAVGTLLPGPIPTAAPSPTPVPTATPPPFTSLALNESTVIGRRQGKLNDTFVRDGRVETLIEKAAPKSAGRYDALEHIWEFYVPDRTSIVFRVNAWHTLSTDEDVMVFEYSTDRVHYTPMFSLTALAPTSTYQQFTLPPSVADHLITIRVRDTNRAFTSQRAEDSVFVDHMEIVSTAGG